MNMMCGLSDLRELACLELSGGEESKLFFFMHCFCYHMGLFQFLLICAFHLTRYVELGEIPAVAGLREAEEQMQLSLLSNVSQYVQSMKLIGVYNDPVQDLSQGFGVSVTVSYGLELLSSEMPTKDGTGIPKAGVDGSTLVTIPMEEIGTTYNQEAWEADHFSYTVLMDLKKQLNVL